MTNVSAAKVSAWKRVRAPLSLIAVAGFLGVVVVAPFTTPVDAQAAPLPDYQRIHQTFVPSESPEMDYVYADVPILTLPDPDEERKKREAEAAEAAREAAAAEQQAAPAAPAAPLRYTGGGSPAEWMAAAGIPESDWGYVDFIVSKESGWQPNAVNPSSGASGLVQALPCSKVPGNCLDPVDNLRWAHGYAQTCTTWRNYCGWEGAYNFWIANSWW